MYLTTHFIVIHQVMTVASCSQVRSVLIKCGQSCQNGRRRLENANRRMMNNDGLEVEIMGYHRPSWSPVQLQPKFQRPKPPIHTRRCVRPKTPAPKVQSKGLYPPTRPPRQRRSPRAASSSRAHLISKPAAAAAHTTGSIRPSPRRPRDRVTYKYREDLSPSEI